MQILKKEKSPRYKRDGIESFLLTSSINSEFKNLSITIVEMEMNGIQYIHNHPPEQIYYILEGEGLMTVNQEQAHVEPGDCICIPSMVDHGLTNTGKSILRYLGATSPAFPPEMSKKYWSLKSQE